MTATGCWPRIAPPRPAAEIYNVDYRVMTREGAYRWYNARSAPVRDAKGVIREWQGVLLPIDDRHRPVGGRRRR